MKNRKSFAASTGFVAILLLIEGVWMAWTIDSVHHLEVIPGTPFATPEDVALAKRYLPAMYVVAIEGILFGIVAAVGAVGLLAGRLWALRMLLVGSVLLVLSAVVAIVMAPQQWDMQAIFISFCVLLWWASMKGRPE